MPRTNALRQMNRTISSSECVQYLALSPPTFAVNFSQATDFQNRRAFAKFQMHDLANDFKVHSAKSQIILVVNLGVSVA